MRKLRKVVAIVTTIAILIVTFTTLTLLVKANDKALYVDEEYIEYCDEMQEDYGISSCLLLAIIECESSGNPKAVSSEGCVGLMQIHMVNNPENFDLYDPYTNIVIGTNVLLDYLEQADGDLYLALSLYNGLGNQAWEWYRNGEYDKFEYAQKVLDLARDIEIERYGN